MNAKQLSGLRVCLLLTVFQLASFQVASAQLNVTTTPPLSPAFTTAISDYVIGQGADANVQVSVTVPAGTRVSVDGGPYHFSSFTTQVNNLLDGQAFKIVSQTGAIVSTYYVRRLPADFPTWTTERPGTPQSEFYIFQPDIATNFSGFKNYTVIADNNGIPVWWYKAPYVPIDGKLLSQGHLGWIAWFNGYAEVRTFDGSITHTIFPVGGFFDNHELQLMPNGNYVFICNKLRGPVDLSAFGGSSTATVLDNVIEEVTPSGSLVWSWSCLDHIPISETGQAWWQTYLVNSNPTDPYHMNSVERAGSGGFICSLRHLDAVIFVEKNTGKIRWKIGGVQRDRSLSFVGDPYGNFGGNHDARLQPDGTITLHDNGTNLGRPARAVRYLIDMDARTATLLEQVTDPNGLFSFCCGSARRLSTGNWVMEWGDNPNVTELAPDSSLVLRLNFTDPFFSYRAVPTMPGQIRRSELRKGMDGLYPRPGTTH